MLLIQISALEFRKDIAEEIGSQEAFTAKILQLLTRHKIINGAKGPNAATA